MEIGLMLGHFDQIEDMEREVKKMLDNGFTHCQLLSWDPSLWTEEGALEFKELFERYGITVTALWCGWEGPAVWNFYEGQETLGLVPETYRYARMKNLMCGADFAAKLGVKHIVSHMGFIPENPLDPQYHSLVTALRTVAEHLAQNGQDLLFETGQETPITMLRCFEDIGLENLGVNLDTANLIVYGKANPADAAELYGKWIKGVHAKDGVYPVNGHDLGHQVPLGEGKVDFHAVLRTLKANGYEGTLTIEREIKGPQQLRDILDAREYLKHILQDIDW